MDFDIAVTTLLNGLSGISPAADWTMAAISKVGPFVVVASVAIRWWSPPESRLSERHLAVLCGLSSALGLLLNQGCLLFVQRVRPYDAGITHLIVAKSGDPSFPSDHATLAFAVAFALLSRQRTRGWMYLAAALVIGASRVFIGIHYASDVVGGAATALIAALLCAALFRPDSKASKLAVRIL